MRQVTDNGNSELANLARQTERENVAAGLWVAFLIGVGCFVLNALAESAQRDECLMRGAAICMNRPQPATLAAEKRSGIAQYLRNTRIW